MTKKTLTAHEKKLQLAEASAPKYGIYVDGGDVEKLVEAIEAVGPIVLSVMNSDSEEKTKRDAIALLKSAMPSVRDLSVSNCSIEM